MSARSPCAHALVSVATPVLHAWTKHDTASASPSIAVTFHHGLPELAGPCYLREPFVRSAPLEQEMSHATQFSDVLEGADRLTADEQEMLVDILRHRLAEQRRQQIATDIQSARSEFQQNQCRPVTPDELIAELSS